MERLVGNCEFRVPDLIREKFSGGLDIKGNYKNCNKKVTNIVSS
jgi:hypothetical protein